MHKHHEYSNLNVFFCRRDSRSSLHSSPTTSLILDIFASCMENHCMRCSNPFVGKAISANHDSLQGTYRLLPSTLNSTKLGKDAFKLIQHARFGSYYCLVVPQAGADLEFGAAAVQRTPRFGCVINEVSLCGRMPTQLC